MCLPGAAPVIQAIGMAASIGGTIYAGIAQQQQMQAQVQALEQQKEHARAIAAAEEQDALDGFGREIARQRGGIIAAGLTLDSPTAVYLGEQAAREMSYEAQSIRAKGQAQVGGISAEQSILKARGDQAVMGGLFGAAGKALTAAPDLWPELLS